MMVKKTWRKRFTAFSSTASRKSLEGCQISSLEQKRGLVVVVCNCGGEGVPCFTRHLDGKVYIRIWPRFFQFLVRGLYALCRTLATWFAARSRSGAGLYFSVRSVCWGAMESGARFVEWLGGRASLSLLAQWAVIERCCDAAAGCFRFQHSACAGEKM